MAQLKDLLVTGPSQFIGNAIFNSITMRGTITTDSSTTGYALNAPNNKIVVKTVDIDKANDYNIIVQNSTAEGSGEICHRPRVQFIQDLGLSQVYNYKGTLSSLNNLKSISPARVGDVYFISEMNDNWACKQTVIAATGDKYTNYWQSIGNSVDLSGYVTKDKNETITGGKTFTNNIALSDSGNQEGVFKGIVGSCSNNYNLWRVGGSQNAGSDNEGYLEISLQDNNETTGKPIYIRQYKGNNSFQSVKREATLLDANGNTIFPGTVTVGLHGTFKYNTADKCIDVLFI